MLDWQRSRGDLNEPICHHCGRGRHFARGCVAKIPKPGIPPSQVGKRRNPRNVSNVYSCDNNENVKLLVVHPVHVYHVTGITNGIYIQFKLDMGAAVSLLYANVWHKISTVTDATLWEWNDCKLVGVEGSDIKLLGVVSMVVLAEISVRVDFLVVEVLNTEAILGLDLLEQHWCTINAQHHVLHIQGKVIPLQGKVGMPQTTSNLMPSADVVLPADLQIPPLSVLEILADIHIPEELQGAIAYLVEPKVRDTTPTSVTIAHVLVRPQRYETQSGQHSLPLCLINLSSEPVKLYKGTKVATVEPLYHHELRQFSPIRNKPK